MKVKRYKEFIKEELVIGKDGQSIIGYRTDLGSKKQHINNINCNIFSYLFNSDPLQLREYIQKNLNLENLKFLGAGGIGLAFDWNGKVIKFTADKSEKNGVEKMLELAPGNKIIDGFAKYYWIKEIDMPNRNQKRIPMDQLADQEDRITKQRLLNKIGNKQILISDQEAENRKKTEKMTKAYIICLEKVTMLDKYDTEIAHLIFLLTKNKYLNPLKDNKNKLIKLIDWIKSDNEEYEEEDYLNRNFKKIPIFSTMHPGITKKAFYSDDPKTIQMYNSIWQNISTSKFIDFSSKMLDIYKKGISLGIPTSDIHEGNLGYRGDELVAYDCM